MPRGKHLSDFEKGQILALHHSCNSISDIARELERSRDVIRSFLSAPESYGTKKRAGRPKKLTDAGKRRILREVINGNLGSASIVKALQIPVKARRVRQVLQDAEHLRYKRMQRTPAMKERHEKERESWAVEKVSWSVSKWSQIVWSDEKSSISMDQTVSRTSGMTFAENRSGSQRGIQVVKALWYGVRLQGQ